MRIEFPGCTPEPLGYYLKGLAVFRLIAEQKDPEVKGWWENGSFWIETGMTRDDVVGFFLNEYQPTPIVAPWNGGSGFYEGDGKAGLEGILQSTDKRFERYRKTIAEISRWPEIPSGASIRSLLDDFKVLVEGTSGKSQETLEKLMRTAEKALIDVQTALGSDSFYSDTIEKLQESVQGRDKGTGREAIRHMKIVRTHIKKGQRSSSKNAILQKCRNLLDDEVVDWLDAAAILKNEEEIDWPPLLGTGGNEGRLDYTNAFMENINRLLISSPPKSSELLLREALFGEPTEGFENSSAGKFDPGRSGGYNQGFGIVRKDFPTNRWSSVLTLEGTVSWVSAIGKRQGVESEGNLHSPFTVRPVAAGYDSSSGDTDAAAKAEIWTPLWSNPVGLKEFKAFLGEGRAEVGRRYASNGIQFAEAAASLGVDRGVKDFVRHSILKRRGDSYIALPVGIFPVKERREVDLVRELETPLARVDSLLRRMKSVPAELSSARRGIDHARFEVLRRGGPEAMKHLLINIGKLERLLATRDVTKEPKLRAPISGLGTRWLLLADDGSVEFRIAAALALIRGTGKVGPFRANLAPVDPIRPYKWATQTIQTAWVGRSFAHRLSNILARRMMDAERLGCEKKPVWSPLKVRKEDIACFVEGSLDEGMIEDLLFGLMWINWGRAAEPDFVRDLEMRWSVPVQDRPVRREYALLKLLFSPADLEWAGKTVKIRPEPSLIPLLRAGRIGAACLQASRRLFSSGLPMPCSAFPDGPDGVRLAAALLIPLKDEHGLVTMTFGKKGKEG